MASSLSAQLSALKESSGAKSAVHQSRAHGTQRPSLLLHHGKAADVDLESIYRLAIDGLDELCDKDEALSPFRESLFAETSKDLVRELQTREVNDKINATVAQYLTMLSPYFLQPEAHYTLEYLIRRYNIQMHSVEAICRSILPFHDTEIFARMVGLLHLDDHSAWSFLKAVQKSQCPVPREALVRKCASDRAVMDLVLAAVDEAYKHGVLARHKQLVAFYGAVLLEVLDIMSTVSEEWMRLLLPHLLKAVRRRSGGGGKGVAGPAAEYQVASYMVLSKMCSSTTLSSAVTEAVLTAMADGLTASLADKAFMAMLIVLRSQGLSILPSSCLGPITRAPGSAAALCALSLANPLVEQSLIPAVLLGLAEGASRERALGGKLLTFVAQLRVPSLGRVVRDVFLTLSKTGVAPPEGTPESELREGVHEIVCKLREREPEAFAEAVKQAEMEAKEAGGDDSGVLAALLLSASPADRAAQQEQQQTAMREEDLALGLVTADAKVRIQALASVAKAWKDGEDVAPPLDLVARAMVDDDYHVALRAVSDDVASPLLERMGMPAASEAVDAALQRWSHQAMTSRKACKVVGSLLDVIRRHMGDDDMAPFLPTILALSLMPIHQDMDDDGGAPSKLVKALASLQRDALQLLASSGHAISAALPKPVNGSKTVPDYDLLDCLGRGIRAHPSECVPVLEATLERLLRLLDSGDPKHLSDNAAKASYCRLMACLASAIQAPSSPSGPTLSGGSRRRLSCPTSSSLVEAFLPLALKQLTVAAAASPGSPAASALADLSPLLVAIAHALPVVTCPYTYDPLLLSLLSLPPPSLTLVLSALQALLIGRYGSSMALPALASVAASSPSSSQVPSAAQVQALSVAATLVAALMSDSSSRHDDGAQECQQQLVASLMAAFPYLMVALCHPVRRVREGVMVVLKALFTAEHHQDDSNQSNALLLLSSPQGTPSSKSAKKPPSSRRRGSRGPNEEVVVMEVGDEEALRARVVACMGRGLVLQKHLLTLHTSNVLAGIRSLLRPGGEDRLSDEEKGIGARILLSAAVRACGGAEVEADGCYKAVTLAEAVLGEQVVASSTVIAELRALEEASSAPGNGRLREVVVLQLMRNDDSKLEGEPLALILDMLKKEVAGGDSSKGGGGSILSWFAKDGARWRGRLSGKDRLGLWRFLVQTLEKEEQQQEVVDLVREAVGQVLEGDELVKAVGTLVQERTEGATGVEGVIMALEVTQLARAAVPGAAWATLLDRYVRVLEQTLRPAAVAAAGKSRDEEGREYMLVLLIETLVDLLGEVQPGTSAANALKAETVLQVIEGSTSLQIRNGAIRLLALLSSREPQAVKPVAMRALSWLGGESVQQGDAYSFAVVQQMLSSVIPAALAAGQSSKGSDPTADIAKIFVDAYDRVPLNRRASLYQCLTRCLGEDSLGAVLLLFLCRTPKEGTESEAEADFLHNLLLRAKVAQQVLSLADLVEASRRLVLLLPMDLPEEEAAAHLRGGQGGRRKAMDLRPLKRVAAATASRALVFVTRHLSHPTFHLCVARAGGQQQQQQQPDESSSALQRAHLLLCEEVLLLLRQPEDPEAKASAKRALEQCKAQLRHVLDAIHGLLSTPSFVAIIQELLSHDDIAVRRKALQLFTSRVEKLRDSGKRLPRAEQQLMMEMLPEVIEVAAAGSTSDPAFRQSAWATVAVLAQAFGRGFSQSFLPLFDHLHSAVHSLTSTAQQQQAPAAAEVQVLSSALLSSASILQALGTHALGKLPRTVPALLDGLEWSCQRRAEDTQESAVVALTAVIATLPNFLNPFLPRIISALLHPSLSTTTTSPQRALSLLASSTQPRLLLPVILAAYPAAQDQGHAAVTALVGVLSEAVSHCSRADVMAFLSQLLAFYLSAMDFRTHALATATATQEESDAMAEESNEEDDIVGVEEAVCESFVALVLKLSEDELRPLFLKVAHWKATGGPSRRTVFFRLVNHLTEKLRSIFVPFFGHIWSDLRNELECVERSESSGSDKEDEKKMKKKAKKESKKRKRTEDEQQQQEGEEESAALQPGGLPLLELVLGALHKCFQYDEGGFLTASRFEAVMSHLVGLVTSLRSLSAGDDATYRRVAEELLVPCISQMACAADKDMLWKPLNHALLMKTRESDWQVRYVALRAVHECFAAVGEEYLVLLPESISFLSELMEDESPEVEALCKKAVAFIEELSGESLDSYLT